MPPILTARSTYRLRPATGTGCTPSDPGQYTSSSLCFETAIEGIRRDWYADPIAHEAYLPPCAYEIDLNLRRAPHRFLKLMKRMPGCSTAKEPANTP